MPSVERTNWTLAVSSFSSERKLTGPVSSASSSSPRNSLSMSGMELVSLLRVYIPLEKLPAPSARAATPSV